MQRPQSISQPPPGVGGGRPNRPGVGVGIGIGAERPLIVLEPPPGAGGGRPNRPGEGVGIGIGAERPLMVLDPPPGVGGGRPNRPGVGVGFGTLGTHVCRIEAPATRPLFCEARAKKGAAGRTLSAAEPLCLYDNIATYLSDISGRSVGEGVPALRPDMTLRSGRSYLSYTRIMVQQARAERRRRGARGVRGPRALAEELGCIQSFS